MLRDRHTWTADPPNGVLIPPFIAGSDNGKGGEARAGSDTRKRIVHGGQTFSTEHLQRIGGKPLTTVSAG